MAVREALAGARLLLTGSTGFLGTALVERLLLDVPLDRLDLLIRGDADKRVRELLASSAFGPARRRLGSDGLAELAASKLRPIPGGLHDATVADDVDLVIHAAATVSFDPPVDEAFTTNLHGTLNLRRLASHRPFLHVSTAYVAGVTRGTQHEEPLELGVDWRSEAAAAARIRDDVEAASRRPELLERLHRRAEREIGKAGPQTAARRAEELRRQWVRGREVGAGRARARSVGWPDVYTFTKALSEAALVETASQAPIAIVRPSIIESALAHPYPGWISGFRMADPVMLGYGRGALPEFPAIPEGVIDLIPVDLVVNGCIVVAANLLAARDEATPRPRVYHLCSGNRNPLQFRHIYRYTRAYFLDNPLPEWGRGTYRVPEWRFPGRRAVERRLRTAEQVLGQAERLVERLPRGRFARESARRMQGLRQRLDFARRYSDLYGPYAEAEVIYTDDHAKALHDALSPADRRDFGFDPASFTWQHYLTNVHLPAITALLRQPPPPRSEPRVVVPARRPDGPPILAVFDVEGTIVDSNVVEAYLWLRLADAGDRAARAMVLARSGARLPRLLQAERHDRGEFLRHFYRAYEGADADSLRALARDTLGDLVLRRLAPAAARRIRGHHRAGHHVVFITGALDFIVEPIAALADDVMSARLREENGRLTGDLTRPPLVGEARASWLRDYAREHGADLSSSYAYADSLSDLPLLEAVGIPVAVNPDVALSRVARARRWPVEEWTAEVGMPRISLPATSALPGPPPQAAGRRAGVDPDGEGGRTAPHPAGDPSRPGGLLAGPIS
ncbi:MAG: HAD-IB family hydrolase [Actinomycetota bacterium]|nr:HAD-IB family hydrolase [Actinomycetota bacterium]